MSPAKFKAIRVELGLTQEELGQMLGFAGKNPICKIETGARNPNKLTVAIMEILHELPPKKSTELIQLLKTHMENN